MSDHLISLAWPPERLEEALEALARRKRLSITPAPASAASEPVSFVDDETLGRWIKATAGKIGLESEAVSSPYADLERMILAVGPALLRIRLAEESRFLVLLGRGQRTVRLLDPELREHRPKPSLISSFLRKALEDPLIPELNRLLENAGVPRRRWARARAAILRERLSANMIGGFWLLRLAPGDSFVRQLRHARVPRYLGVLAGAHAVQYALGLLAWFVVGRGALQGRLDNIWLWAWALLLLTIIPLRLLTTWMQGVLAIKAGGLLKQRLLYGALRFDPDQIRHQGSGQLLGRIIETEAVESLAISGGFQGLLAGIELSMAALVLMAGSGGWPHAGLLLMWTLLASITGWRYFTRRRRWTRERMGITNDLVERMVGHRTRLAQEPRERWHAAEDQSLAHYFGSSRAMDRTSVMLSGIVARGWLLVGMLGLAPAFIRGGSSTSALAVGLGGTLLAFAAYKRFAAGVAQFTDAAIAWKQVAPLFHAGAGHLSAPAVLDLAPDLNTRGHRANEAMLDARDLTFRYRERVEPVIAECSLRIFAGERLLLEGPSGGGKSTLASLLVGLREPDSGLLLLRGFDRRTLGGENWRRLIVSAPQFHENHVMTETFAFNLLMGRRWPARPDDLAECEAVCRELGLGELIERMPAGLLQMVGETGWRLSHGERSRLYIARALLQQADLIVLDESFAALDPENLARALKCVLNRASTLLVIAHP